MLTPLPGTDLYAEVEDQLVIRGLRDNVYDYNEAVLKTANFEMENAQSEALLLQNLQQRSQSVSGQKEAIQAGNEIALQLVAQLDRLKILTASQAQSQSIYMSQQEAEKEAKQKYIDDLLDYDPNETNPNNNKRY